MVVDIATAIPPERIVDKGTPPLYLECLVVNYSVSAQIIMTSSSHYY